MLAHWQLMLSEFDIDIIHRPDVENKATNASSRHETKGAENTDINEVIHVAIIHLHENKNETTEISLHTICHICDHNIHKTGRMMPEVQAFVVLEHSKCERPPRLAALSAAEPQGPACQQYATTNGHPKSRIDIDSIGLLVRQSTINGAIQTALSKVFQAGLPYLSQHSSLAEPSGRRTMYDALRLEYYWPRMSSDVCTTVEQCQ